MKFKALGAFAALIICCLLFAFHKGGKPGNDRQQKKLPVFKLGTPSVDEKFVQDAAKNLLGISAKTLRIENSLAIEDGLRVIDVDQKTGAIWASNREEMWNPESKAQVLDEKRARVLADNLLEKYHLLPAKSKFASYDFSNTGNTFASIYNSSTKQRDDKKIDVQ